MSVLENTQSLLETIKKHILLNLNSKSVDMLSTMANIEKNENGSYDYDSIDDVLVYIQNYFTKKEQYVDRNSLYGVYAARILVDNAEQLVSTYNRVLVNVREFFPDFNLVHEDHNGVFGVPAAVSCMIRKCSDEELANVFTYTTLDPLNKPTKEEIEENVEDMKIHYEEEYFEDLPRKTKSVTGENAQDILSKNISKMINYTAYSGGAFDTLNAFLRGETRPGKNIPDMVKYFSRFAHNLVLTMTLDNDITLYRGDGVAVSSQKLTTRGMYSASLSPTDMGKFVQDGGRMIKITIPRGTPILPIILHRVDEGEIVLLPGTILEKQTQMDFDSGHYAEYVVISNPPPLTDLEEATIFMNSITVLFEELRGKYVSMGGRKDKNERKKFVESLDPSTGPTLEEQTQFAVDFVNSRYNCDW